MDRRIGGIFKKWPAKTLAFLLQVFVGRFILPSRFGVEINEKSKGFKMHNLMNSERGYKLAIEFQVKYSIVFHFVVNKFSGSVNVE